MDGRLLLLLPTLILARTPIVTDDPYLDENSEGANNLEKQHGLSLKYYTKLREKLGRKLTAKEINDGYLKWAESMPQDAGNEQITKIREFVKHVGPILLDKPEYAHDGPMHIVLERCDEILQAQVHSEYMDSHPYIKGRILAGFAKEFMRKIEYFNREDILMPKDEL